MFELFGDGSLYNNENLCDQKPDKPNIPYPPIIPNPNLINCGVRSCKKCFSDDPKSCLECMDGYYVDTTNFKICKLCSEKGCRKCPNDHCLLSHGYIEPNQNDFPIFDKY